MVQKFCDAKTLSFQTRKDAQMIIDSGYYVEPISMKKSKADSSDDEKFICHFLSQLIETFIH